MLKRGEVVKDRWRIEERLGKGTFCELHRASDLSKKTGGAAVKVEVQGMQRSVLKVWCRYSSITVEHVARAAPQVCACECVCVRAPARVRVAHRGGLLM